MKYKRKLIAFRDEWCEDGLYSWDFYKTFKDVKNDENYETSGCSLCLDDVINWQYDNNDELINFFVKIETFDASIVGDIKDFLNKKNVEYTIIPC